MPGQYHYVNSEPGLWTVGVGTPKIDWMPESDHTSPEEAAKRVAFLNGSVSMADFERVAIFASQQIAWKDAQIDELKSALRECLRVLVECDAPCDDQRKAVITQAQELL